MSAHKTEKTITYGGIPNGYLPFFLHKQYENHDESVVFTGGSNESCERLAAQIQNLDPDIDVLCFPGWDCLPYDRVSPGLSVMTKRLRVLSQILQNPDKKVLLIVAANAMMQRVPPKSALKNQSTTLSVGGTVQRDVLFKTLHNMGYHRVETVYEHGDFAVRGSIIDIFPIHNQTPVRIDCFGDEIETLKEFDATTQRSLGGVQSISLSPASEVLLTPKTIARFKSLYPNVPAPHHNDAALFEILDQGRPFQGHEHWLPLFYDDAPFIHDYMPNALYITQSQSGDAMNSHHALIQDYYTSRLTPMAGEYTFRPLQPDRLYKTLPEIQAFQKSCNLFLSPFVGENDATLPVKNPVDFTQKRLETDFLTKFCKALNQTSRKKAVVISVATQGSKDRLTQILNDEGLHHLTDLDHFFGVLDLKPGIYMGVGPFENGFITQATELYTEIQILGRLLHKKNTSKRNSTKFFQEMAQMQPQDLVVHKEHGLGRYIGLEAVSINNIPHDCLVLMYDGGDKLFLPVENIDLLSRYGNDSSLITLDKLGGTAWNNKRQRVKKKIQIIADYLIQLAAERSLKTGDIFKVQDAAYQEFCKKFPYTETDDQARAIEAVTHDFSTGKPMDRLVCGDVGFGKTEVAMRAAFLAVSNKKQVAIVAPTTLLCRQHFQNFKKRFDGLPFKIAQLSRLVAAKESKIIRDGLNDGSIDIVVATHTLFSDKTQFSNLGLMIVDEEQHFGVKQKEKLKQLRNDVHVLTLTATPIPRTLQLSLSGVRDLSLITTPPVDRLPVRTFVMPYDPHILRESIMREYNRGGQIFYITPRLEDLPLLEERLRTLVPEVKFATAHGQLSPADIENTITDFYDRKFDVLLSTNIVESGIDIPTANTIIVHRSDLFGLGQLYQLRGRVGRSKSQAYAYLTLNNAETVSDTATKRLQVLQNLDTLGGGFSVASHDMEIRGAGSLVGEEQSGHIKEVGVELYQTLLQEAIIMARAQSEGVTDSENDWRPNINLGTAVLIPEHYVADLSLRLQLYKRIANLETRDHIDEFATEMIDRFGKLPPEVHNLFAVIEIKNICKKAHINRVDVGPKGFVIGFHKDAFPKPDLLIGLLQTPDMVSVCKIRPDQKIFFALKNANDKDRIKACKSICGKIRALLL